MEDIKTVDELKAAFPELVAQVENSAKASGNTAGIEAERARIQGIEAIEAAIGDKELVNSAKYGDTPLTAEQLAFKAMQAQAAIGATVLANLEKDAQASGVEGVAAAPNSGAEGGDDPANTEVEVKGLLANYKNMKNGGVK